MQLTIERPHVRVCCKDGSWWALPPAVFEDIVATWTQGTPFFRTSDAWGDLCVIKLSDVTGIALRGEESLAIVAAEDDERSARETFGT